MTRTRIGMMLPGAVSLGAYEGGALAAILAAVQAAGGELAVDAIASASAGSITAVVASRALLRGADPFKLMVATWVDLPSLDHLETHVWKPLLHEVAAGRMDVDMHGIDYLTLAHWHRFRFRQGHVVGLATDRALDAQGDDIATVLKALAENVKKMFEIACTWSGRGSFASMRFTGLPCSCRWACPCPA